LQSKIAGLSELAGKKFDLDKSANDIRLIRERDHISHDRLVQLLKFAFSDSSWWASKITSTKFLRNNLEKIEAQMNGASAKQKIKDLHEHTNQTGLL